MTIDPRKEEVASEAPDEIGAPSVLAALQTFKATQERRVSTWSEYEDAIKVHLNSSRATGDHVQSLNDAGVRTTQCDQESASAADSQPQESSKSQSQSPSQNGQFRSHSHSHYQSPQSINNNVMSEILRLVTSSLLDCSHETRVIQTELEARFQRKDLSDTVGKIQDLENALLRKIVERDQIKKIGQLRQGNDRGRADEGAEEKVEDETSLQERENRDKERAKIQELEKGIAGIKSVVEEQMMEIRAELAEAEAEP